MMKSKTRHVPDPQAQFEQFYRRRCLERQRRGEMDPEAVGKLEAREQIRRERAEMAALMRSWAA